MNIGVIRMLLRPEPGGMATIVIPATAFAIVTTLVLTVIGGAQKFWTWTDDYALTYQSLAAIALMLLVVPLASLGGAAARLSARRRDERLSTLRLMGVTPAGVGVLTVIESTVIAGIGVLIGVVGHLALVPLVGLIPFRGGALGANWVLLSPGVIAATCAAAILLATVSAIIGLRQVVVSPLGVRMRAQAAKAHWIRAVAAVLLLGAAFTMSTLAPTLAGAISITVIVAAVFGGAIAVMNVIGPWSLKVASRRQVKKATTPVRLLAARTVLDDPKGAWRQVGGMAMASFMAVFAGTGVALMDTLGSGSAATAEAELIMDMRTGLIITLIASFLMVAASVGVTQASDVLDQRPLHLSLHRLGMPEETVDAARRRAIMSPLLLTALGSALCAAVVLFPLLGMALIVAPLALLTIAAVLAVGILTVWLSTRVTRPLLRPAFAAA